ncbi:MAG: hypothetical protein K0R43_1989 [Pseudoduganella sp.]|jgi:hypothetical protein|nr:hypothetical protein [Pseudoduganella sp.]
MKKLPVLFLLMAAGGAMAADDAALLRCRAMAEASARLACYDAIPARAASAAAPAAPAAAPAARVAAPAPAVSQAFELQSTVRKQAQEARNTTLASAIVGRFEGWDRGTLIKLANGQVWRVEDDSSEVVYLDSPKATLRVGALGAVYIDIEGARGAPRVRRVQ